MNTDYKTNDLLEEITETTMSGIALPFIHRRIVKDEEIVALVDEIKETLPEDIKVSRDIIRDREKIIDSAKVRGNNTIKEAESKAAAIISGAENQAAGTVAGAEQKAAELVQMAQTEAARLVSESNIVKESTAQAQSIIEQARAEAERIQKECKRTCDDFVSKSQTWSDEIKKGAFDYASQILRQSHSLITSTASELASRVAALEQTMNNLGMEYDTQSRQTVESFRAEQK